MAQVRSTEVTPPKPASRGTEGTPPLRRHRLALARAAWLMLAILAVGLFVAGLPSEFSRLATVCAGPTCAETQLAPGEARELARSGVSATGYAAYQVGLMVVTAAVWVSVGALIFWRSDGRMPLLVSLFLVTFGVATFFGFDAPLAQHPVWGWPVAFVQYVGDVSFILFLYLFPDGRFVPRRTRWLVLAWAAYQANEYLFRQALFDPPDWLDIALLLGLFAVPAVWIQVYRYRRASGPEGRRQTRWVVLGIVSSITASAALLAVFLAFPELQEIGSLPRMVLDGALVFAFLPIPISIAVAVLYRGLFDVDFVVNRALVYGALTACVVALYVLVVGGLGALLQTRGSLPASLVATGVVAVLFAPLRARLQKGVNRLMYGERDDPHAVLSRLGERLEGTLDPDQVLATVVATVRETLRLPYAAIETGRGESLGVAVSSGKLAGKTLDFPLAYRGERVGSLTLATRAGEKQFSASDRRLLEELTRQVGVAVYAVGLTADLRRSRERLVSAREEERRRIRRDLHDGLGPTLGSLPLKLDLADDLIDSDPEAARRLMRGLKKQARKAVADVRTLVHALRPSALDELGLIGAVEEQAAQYRHGGLDASVRAPESLPELPAAVEVAAYRIVGEALTNVARHAAATSCKVRIALAQTGRTLELEIRDDGRGLSAERGSGLGLHSMRERAEELGGRFAVESPSGGGTRVRAGLPLGGSARAAGK